MHNLAGSPGEVAQSLEAANAAANHGKGSGVCRAVISELRRNDVQGARAIASLDFDKVRQYPELAGLFLQSGLVSAKLR